MKADRSEYRNRVIAALEALEENIGDLEKELNVTPGEAVQHDVWLETLRRFRKALYSAESQPDVHGRLRVVVDFAEEI